MSVDRMGYSIPVIKKIIKVRNLKHEDHFSSVLLNLQVRVITSGQNKNSTNFNKHFDWSSKLHGHVICNYIQFELSLNCLEYLAPCRNQCLHKVNLFYRILILYSDIFL